MSDEIDPKAVQELVEKADQVLGEKGWCEADLTNWEGAHCALGAIGYARWGEEFDNVARSGDYPYGMLMSDPVAAAAMVSVANEILESKGKPELFLDPTVTVCTQIPGGKKVMIPKAAQLAQGIIVPWNDSRNDNGTEGSKQVRRMFKGANSKMKTWLRDHMPTFKKPVKVEPVVEHVKAPEARPIRKSDIKSGVEIKEVV